MPAFSKRLRAASGRPKVSFLGATVSFIEGKIGSATGAIVVSQVCFLHLVVSQFLKILTV